MTKRCSVAEARDNLARLLHEVEEGSSVEITRRGRPVAVLLSVRALERLRRGPGRFAEAALDFRRGRDMEGLALDDALADVRDRSPGRPIPT